MKKRIGALLILVICLFTASCSIPAEELESQNEGEVLQDVTDSNDDANAEDSADEVQDDTADAAEDTQRTAQDMQIVGTDEFGYISIPADWGLFHDLDGNTDLQYSDINGDSIITLNVFNFDGLSEEQAALVTAEIAAQSVWYNLEQDDVAGIEGAKVALGAYDAFQIYGYFMSEDSNLLSYIICWTFEDENGVIHYIAAEAPVEHITDVLKYIEDSYTLTYPEG